MKTTIGKKIGFIILIFIAIAVVVSLIAYLAVNTLSQTINTSQSQAAVSRLLNDLQFGTSQLTKAESDYLVTKAPDDFEKWNESYDKLVLTANSTRKMLASKEQLESLDDFLYALVEYKKSFKMMKKYAHQPGDQGESPVEEIVIQKDDKYSLEQSNTFSKIMINAVASIVAYNDRQIERNIMDALNTHEKLRFLMVTILGIGLFLSFNLIFFTNRLITEPVIQLIEGVKAIARGDLNVKTKVRSNDEIGQLSFTFNEMAKKLKDSRSGLEKRTIELEDSNKELERSKERIQKNEERLNLAIKGGKAGIWDWFDINEDEQWWSPEFYGLLGYQDGEIKAGFRAFNQLLHPDDKKYTVEAMDDHLKFKQPFNIEYRLKTKQGEYRWFNGHGEAIRDDEDRPVRMSGTIVDITARKNAEEQLKESAEELSRSNRELEQFAYVASHDLQEPLRMVASFCQKLEKKYNDQLDDSAKEYIHFAVDGAKRMQGLVDALLTYARVGKKKADIAAVDLNKVLQTILHDLDAAIKEKSATIKVGPLPVIMADEIQMHQLFQNFLTNALKFKGDRLPVVEVSARKKNDGWEFAVSDNGIGIEEQHFQKLFVIFQRLHTRTDYPGTGIGLALCKKIIENFGGKIGVTSKVGQGTTFNFTLNVKEVHS